MQPDYNQLWRSMNNGQAHDAHFYAFFEDSLNQFISTNSSPVQITSNAEEQNNKDQNIVNIE